MLVRVLVVVLLLVAGCAATSPPSSPTVTGRFGSDPVISIPNGRPDGKLEVSTVIQGHGPVVRPKDYVLLNVEGKVWAGNRLVVDSFTDRQPQGLPLSTAMPAWRRLAGQRVGSRVMMVVPPRDGFGPGGNPQANIMGSDTLVFVFDVVDTMSRSQAATGRPVPYRSGAVHVTSARRVSVARGATPPATLRSVVLRRGSGPEIVNGDTVVVQYTGVVWRTGKVFDSSWTRGFPEAFVLGSGQVLAGWEQGLGGRTVGSRVLLTVPPALGYGTTGKPPDVRPTDTLVFVVDIIAAS